MLQHLIWTETYGLPPPLCRFADATFTQALSRERLGVVVELEFSQDTRAVGRSFLRPPATRPERIIDRDGRGWVKSFSQTRQHVEFEHGSAASPLSPSNFLTKTTGGASCYRPLFFFFPFITNESSSAVKKIVESIAILCFSPSALLLLGGISGKVEEGEDGDRDVEKRKMEQYLPFGFFAFFVMLICMLYLSLASVETRNLSILSAVTASFLSWVGCECVGWTARFNHTHAQPTNPPSWTVYSLYYWSIFFWISKSLRHFLWCFFYIYVYYLLACVTSKQTRKFFTSFISALAMEIVRMRVWSRRKREGKEVGNFR